MGLINIRKDVRDIKRLEQILGVLFKHELGFLIEKIKLKHFLPLHKRLQQNKFEKINTQPERIRKILEELGGTFVKLGQLLSLRPDLIPAEYCREFAKLQDEVKPFSGKEAENIIKTDMGKEVKDVFTYFSDKPISAASIGQVHIAVLKDGTKAAVKVQRPGIKKAVETDIDILYHLAHLTQKKFKMKIINPVEIVKEFEEYTEKELDYNIEAKNIDRVYRNFSHDNITRIPKVYWEATTEKVLTMEFIKGLKVSELDKAKIKVNKARVAENIVNSVFKQVFIDGFFHADPHPGNILVLKNNKIAFLDFGIVGHFDEEMKEKFVNLFISLIQENMEGISENLSELGFVGTEINMDEFKEDLYHNLDQFYNVSLEKANISLMFNEMLHVARKYGMKFPSDLVLFGKAIMTLEGTALQLDPDFNLVENAKPFVKKLLRKRIHPKYIAEKFVKTGQDIRRFIDKFPEQTSEMLRRIKEGDMSIKKIDKDLKELIHETSKSSNRIAIGLLITAFLIASALIINMEQPLFLGFPAYSLTGFIIALIFLMFLMYSILREKGVR